MPTEPTQHLFAAQVLHGPEFSRRLIAWQRQHGRHDLPWQKTRDTYRIWLSEIMLQQTQVSAVVPYYERFIKRFPTLASVAEAPLDDVMQLWSGLGYYTRGRNLHACARRVMADHGGIFPTDAAKLIELPGIGRSTAAAIAVFASGARAAILDGNVKRVLSRVFGVDGYVGEGAVEKQLWSLAEELLPEAEPSARKADNDGLMIAYTQGLMDLGATLCTPRNPNCAGCPMRDGCVAHLNELTEQLPVKKKKAALPERATVMLVLLHGRNVLLQKRPPVGIWGGLLSLPECPIQGDMPKSESLCDIAQRYGQIISIEKLEPFTHVFTHFKLNVKPYRVDLARIGLPMPSDAVLSTGLSGRASVGMVADPSHEVWLNLREAHDAALPTPIRKLLHSLKI